MEFRLIFMALICLGIAQLAFAAEDNYPFASPQQQQRFVQFTKEVRCLACQSQSLFDASSSYAADMRARIYQMFNRGMTEDQIRQQLTEKYGDFILFSPPVRLSTLFLWLGPIIMLFAAAFALWRYGFRMRNGYVTAQC